MFYPQEMTEIEIIVPEKDALAVTCVLADQGVFHQVDASYLSSKAGFDSNDSWRERSTACAAFERRILTLMHILDVKEGAPPAANCTALVEVEAVRSVVEQLEADIQETVGELAQEQKRLEQLQRYVQQLEPLLGIDVDVSALRNPRYVFSMIGVMPADHLERLHTALARIPFTLLTLRQDSQASRGASAVVWLMGTQHNADVLERAARSAYLNPLSLPEAYHGTPAQIIDAVREEMERVQQHITEQQAMMAEFHQIQEDQLQELLWQMRASRVLTDAVARFGKLRYTYLIVGWVPSANLTNLTQQLKMVSEEILIEINPLKRGSVSPDIPVSLNNPGIFRPFQQLVTIYGRPRYQEIDPTILLAITFPLLFGAMFGDVGHGLVLALLGGLVVSGKLPSLKSMTNLGAIVLICGVVAMVFGFLYGSIFGLENVLPALWIRPLDNIMQILITTIGVGIGLLSLGFILGIANAWIVRDWGRMIAGHTGIAGALLFWSLVGLAVELITNKTVIPPIVLGLLALVSGLAVMFSEALSRLIEGRRPVIEGSVVDYVVQAIFEMADTLIGILSNSLSYVRVGAFAVAHGGLSAVVFILAEMVSPTRGIGYWIVLVLGNLFIIGFEGLIVGIQTLRLEYYEFFSKFFTGGGASYTPVKLLSKASE